MVEVTGDLWTYVADFRVITTNGTVRRDGCAVMGRGCALEATRKYPALQREFGVKLQRYGNRGFYFEAYRLFTFPVKHAWHERADLDLIRTSTEWFNRQLLSCSTYVMPRPGCGNGQLRWIDVQPIVATLPDNVFVIDFGRA